MRPAVLLATLVLAASGCAEPATKEAPTPDAHDVESTPFTGKVLGVAVDEAIAPLPGVNVTLGGQTVVTGADGRFGFGGVPPGEYWVVGRAPGRLGQRVLVDVTVGSAPEWAVLALVPVTEPRAPIVPRFEMFHVEGHIDAAAFACAGGVTIRSGGEVLPIGMIDDWYKAVQAEFLWEPASELATVLEAALRADDGTRPSGRALASGSGVTPLVVRADPPEGPAPPFDLQAGVGAGCDTGRPANPGLLVAQDYEVFVHVFYNVKPQQGWSYLRDGDPEF